ncbi:GNAT family N-acetyltransferase [Tritonibacter aquimaris]|nr:GNAT family N-acetyltransferase [Tritonibacter aquimaris]
MFPFLYDHIQSSMFLLGNLRDFGLTSDAPYGMQIWVLEQGRGVFAISNSGTVLMQAPDFEHWDTAADLIRGRDIHGVLGDAPQVRAFLDAADLTNAPTHLNADDLGFHLDLTDIKVAPRPDDELHSLEHADRGLLEGWRADYNCEALGFPPELATEKAAQEIGKYIAHNSHRVLISGGEPVAMTGFNTQFEDVVQIGGVFTPKDKRGQGHARQALAMHLLEARDAGAKQAVLFAANAAAARAYEAVGFRLAGTYALVLFSEVQKISTSPVEGCT